MNTQNNDVQNDDVLFAQLAQVETDLTTARLLQQSANGASILAYNAWADTDALIDNEQSTDLIKRLEIHSTEADAIKTEADALVKSLREQKRTLTRQLKAKIYSTQLKVERAKAEAIADEKVKAIVEAERQAKNALEATETQAELKPQAQDETEKISHTLQTVDAAKSRKAKTKRVDA